MIICLENKHLRVEVNSLGAELWSVYDKRRERHLLWQGDADFWPRRSPLLFPICGRSRGGVLPLHGFIRDYDHSIASRTGERVTFRCLPNAETLAMYPYHFEFYTSYRLEGGTLSCTLRVLNRSDGVLPFSVGFHSGFFADDGSAVRFEHAEHCAALHSGGDGFLCGRSEDYMAGRSELSLGGEPFPSTVILERPRSRFVDIVTGGEARIRLGFEGFPYLALWVKEHPVRFVCVEPWHGLPDGREADGTLLGKPGIQTLQPGESFDCAQTITSL